jgi:hypothetical protein
MQTFLVLRQWRRAVLLLGIAWLFTLATGFLLCSAQTYGNGPVTLIISYRAIPKLRASFRQYMQTTGIRQFATWKNQHVFRCDTILFSSYASDSDDMFVILSFARYTDTARWMKIETTMPGGLSPQALEMATPRTSILAEELIHGEIPGSVAGDSVTLILPYDVTTDATHYAQYVKTYAEPQFRGWMQHGILSSYTMYENQNPAGAPWSSLLLLQYKNVAALAKRNQVKNAVRATLRQTDPAWKAMSETKTSLRKEKLGIITTSIGMP